MATVVESADQLTNYRHLVTLPDGLRVLLRPLVTKDRDALVALFANLPPEETQVFRSNITNMELVASWAEKPDYTRVFPLVALVGERIVGNSTLHLGNGFRNIRGGAHLPGARISPRRIRVGHGSRPARNRP